MAETAENKVKINSIEDFKKETWIEKVEWIEFKAFSITREELEKFKNEIQTTIPERDKIGKIKAFLTEKARLEVHWEKERKELKESINHISNKLPTWTEEVKQEVAKIDWKLKEITSKEWMEKIAGEWLNLAKSWIGEAISWLFDFLSKIPFIGWLFAALGKMFWFWAKVEEAKEIVKDKVENIDKDNIKKQVSKIITDNKTPISNDNLNKSLNSISDEDYKKINAKLEKKEALTIEDIKNLDSFKILFSKEWIKETVKEELTKSRDKFKDILIKDIEKKYSIKLDQNNINKLDSLVKENLKINETTATKLSEIYARNEFNIWDISRILKESWTDTALFSIKLMASWIIPLSALWIDFAKSWVEIASNALELTLGALWLKETIDIEVFNKKLEELNDAEKWLLIWLLYRKWWIFLSILWSTSSMLSRFIIEWITPTTVWTIESYKSSIQNNFSKQAESLNKISSKLWRIEINKESEKIIKSLEKNLELVWKNYITLDILKKYENTNDITKVIQELTNKWIQIEWNPKTLETLKESLSKNFKQGLTEFYSAWNALNKFWFWAQADLYELNTKLEKITKYQNAVLDWNKLAKLWYKIWETISIPQISRIGDRMSLHFNSKEEAREFGKKLSVIFQQSPELIKWIFDKMPIFVVAGIAANSEKPFFEEIQKEFSYLFPVIWPILLMSEASFNYKDIELKNLAEFGTWRALLTIDWVFLTKEFSTWWLKWMWRYMIKPLTDIYSLGRWTAEFWYNIYKVWNAWYMTIIKESLAKTWALKWKIRAIVLAWLIIWWWINYAMASEEEKEEINKFLDKDWKIDNNKLKEEANKMSLEEKEEIIKLMIAIEFWETFSDNIKFKVNNEKLTIDSKNKNVQSAFIINNDILEKLSLLWISEYTFNYYWQS